MDINSPAGLVRLTTGEPERALANQTSAERCQVQVDALVEWRI